MTWYFNGKPVTQEIAESYLSFVYIITNKVNGRKYIGKKLLTFTRSKKVAGSTRKKKHKMISDWESYYGSNKGLIEDVKKHGPDNFHREIVRFCATKSEASYHEAKLQFTMDAIISESFYNDWIMVKVHRNRSLDKV